MICKFCHSDMELVDTDPELGDMWDCPCGASYVKAGPGNAFDITGWRISKSEGMLEVDVHLPCSLHFCACKATSDECLVCENKICLEEKPIVTSRGAKF